MELSWWDPVDAVCDLFCRPDWVFKYEGGLYDLVATEVVQPRGKKEVKTR